MAEEVFGGAGAARDVQRDTDGTVLLTQAGTDQVTGITATGVQTLSVTTNTQVMYDKQVLKANTGSGDATIKRNGVTVTNVTGFAGGTTVSPTYSTPRTTVSKWTGSVNFAGLPTAALNTVVTTTGGEVASTTGYTTATPVNVTGTGTKAVMKWSQATGDFGASQTVTFLVSGVQIGTSGATTGTISGTGTFTNSNFTCRVHCANVGTGGNANLPQGNITFQLYGTGSATATLTASNNQITTVT